MTIVLKRLHYEPRDVLDYVDRHDSSETANGPSYAMDYDPHSLIGAGRSGKVHPLLFFSPLCLDEERHTALGGSSLQGMIQSGDG
jgi:hypothetical protein